MDNMRDGVDARHSRRGASLPARTHRYRLGRRCGALVVAGSLALGVGVSTFGLPTGLSEGLTPQAVAVEAPPSWAPNTGHGEMFRDSSGTSHWLGANKAPDGGGLLWCIEFGPVPVETTGQMADVRELMASDQRGDVDASLRLNPAQTGWLWLKYEGVDTDVSRAALSVLAHANFDVSSDAPKIVAEIAAKLPAVYAQAQKYAAEARSSTPQSFKADYTNPNAVRTGNVHGIQSYGADGKPVAGVPVTVTLNGPAKFDATGTNTWSGKTGSSPITLTWTATGTGKVTGAATYQQPRYSMVRYGNDGSVQDMLRPKKGAGDPEDKVMPLELEAHYDFQPVATSNVAESDSKVVDHDKGVIRDTIHVKADESYKLSPEWMYDGKGQLVPVVFEGTAYYTGSVPAAESAGVPKGAKVVGRTSVTAKGPGDYTAEIKVKDLDPDFITWVWQVKKSSQGDYASYVARDWSDSFGLADETTSSRGEIEVDSSVQSNVTKRGTYLVDSLYIEGFDKDHTKFEGSHGFGADVDDLTQALFFFPKELEVTDANLAKAQKVGEVQVDARNGYVDRVGDSAFKMLDGNPEGTYVFITSFKGDDRTKPFTSSAEDKSEQFVVDKERQIKTTATDKSDGDKVVPVAEKVTITDKVCQVKDKGLDVGKTYTLTATAMDKATGQAILDPDGKPYTGTASWTVKGEDDCGSVDVTLPTTALKGAKIVMFENVAEDGRTVVVHTDINDVDQTVTVEQPPTPPSLPVTGASAGLVAGLVAVAGGLLAGGAGVLTIRRRKATATAESQA